MMGLLTYTTVLLPICRVRLHCGAKTAVALHATACLFACQAGVTTRPRLIQHSRCRAICGCPACCLVFAAPQADSGVASFSHAVLSRRYARRGCSWATRPCGGMAQAGLALDIRWKREGQPPALSAGAVPVAMRWRCSTSWEKAPRRLVSGCAARRRHP